MAEKIKKIAVLTSGGDAPGMNAAIRASVRHADSNGLAVCGFHRGYCGVLEDDYVPLDRRSVSNIVGAGGTFLMTDRSPEFNKPEGRVRAAEVLRSHDVDALIVIGGDGSLRGALDLYNDTGIPVVGIPGTIDNDLAYTDFTLGFDTAVNTVLWAINSLRDTMNSHNKVTFVEVMGRHCGDIALHAGLSGGAEYILVPEVPFDLRAIADDILGSVKLGKKSNLIVVAEGAGKMEDLCREFAEYTGLTPRQTRLGFIQRGGSPTYRDRLLACRFGIRAVDLLLAGKGGYAVGVRGTEIIELPIAEAVAMKKTIDLDLYCQASSLI